MRKALGGDIASPLTPVSGVGDMPGSGGWLRGGQRPVWLVLAIGLCGTLLAWHLVYRESMATGFDLFRTESEIVKIDIVNRMRAYEQLLHGGASVLYTWPSTSRARWRSYVAGLKIEQRYPGLQGVGFAKVVEPAERAAHEAQIRREGFPDYAIRPAGERSVYTAIVYLEPFDWRNQRAFGYDMFSEPVRRAAMERARDQGATALSGKVTLVQETEQGVQAGFLLYVPVYSGPDELPAVAERSQALVGYVYSPFRMNNFMDALLAERPRNVALEVFDGESESSDAGMYGGHREAGQGGDEPPRFVTTSSLELYGRLWTLRFSSLPSLPLDTRTPLMVLSGGVLISLLLASVAWSLVRNRAQAAAAAERLQSDAAKRERVEAQLRESEAVARQVLDTALDAYVRMDRHGVITEWNAMAEAAFGWSKAEALGRSVAETIIPTNLRDAHRQGLAGFLELGQGPVLNRRIELEALHRDGTTFPIEATIIAVETAMGPVFSGFIRDLRERKEAEAQLRQAQKMEAIGQLTGGIAHDFNNLLAVMLGNLEFLEERLSGDPDLRGLAENAITAVARGGELTRRLLAYSRRAVLIPTITDIDSLIKGVGEMLQRTLGETIEVRVKLAPVLWRVRIDRGQLEDSLLNLAINARDAMPSGGRLIIEAENRELDEAFAAHTPDATPGRFVMIGVSDSGIGMPPEVAERAFEPFFTTKETGRGTGLGLSMVYGFVRQSGGHIKIYSEVGHGTTVRLYLPRASGEAQVVMESEEAEERHEATGIVLVVEDDRDVRSVTVTMLTALGYQVLAAEDGPTGLEILTQRDDIDVLITDIVLPRGMNGLELAHRVKALRPGVGTILMSGYARDAVLEESEWDDSAVLISKPFRKVELVRALQRVAGEPCAPGRGD